MRARIGASSWQHKPDGCCTKWRAKEQAGDLLFREGLARHAIRPTDAEIKASSESDGIVTRRLVRQDNERGSTIELRLDRARDKSA